jgi:cytosine-specific methyltransferase
MINNKLTYISLFSSAGVGCYGFKLEDFECVATNEIITKRLAIQKLNNKCTYQSAYINDDIKLPETKQKINEEIQRWYKNGNDQVDVIVATPPCQGMSVANHKKRDNEIDRNSLVTEGVSLIKQIKPRFFIVENVAAFWKTGCLNSQGKLLTIGEMIMQELGADYQIAHKIINFKNYGSNSSRKRTLVIGVENKLATSIKPEILYPDWKEEVSLEKVIGKMKSLEWGEYNENDFFHSFRTYPLHMRNWIKGIKQGQSAFENQNIENRPHQIINGKLVKNKAKNGDKYKRQEFNKVAPCIHTRNDQLASQNTVHPIDDRVFSIRELMKMMTIPDSFQWINQDLNTLNKLTLLEKKNFSKKHEMNIRQCIGEAVPTAIFHQIAKKIKQNSDLIK